MAITLLEQGAEDFVRVKMRTLKRCQGTVDSRLNTVDRMSTTALPVLLPNAYRLLATDHLPLVTVRRRLCL
jgi:hypothetical protein